MSFSPPVMANPLADPRRWHHNMTWRYKCIRRLGYNIVKSEKKKGVISKRGTLKIGVWIFWAKIGLHIFAPSNFVTKCGYKIAGSTHFAIHCFLRKLKRKFSNCPSSEIPFFFSPILILGKLPRSYLNYTDIIKVYFSIIIAIENVLSYSNKIMFMMQYYSIVVQYIQ